jgi:hypothetical protein
MKIIENFEMSRATKGKKDQERRGAVNGQTTMKT